MTEVIRSYIQDGIGLIQLAGLLIVGFVVLAAWAKTKSVTATLSAMVLGALVLGYLYKADWFGQKMAEDIVNRENGMHVLTGSTLPANLADLEALALLAARTAITVLWVIGATLALVLVVKLLGWRYDAGSPARAAKRAMIRHRWESVARSCGLAVARDKRSSFSNGFDMGDLFALVTQPVDRKREGSSTSGGGVTVERLPRIRHGHTSPDRKTVTYTLTPARGQTVEDVADKAQAIADGLGVHRVVVHRTGPNRGELVAHLRPVFNLSKSSTANTLRWGRDEYGNPVGFPLGRGHMLIASETEGGKSTLINALIASAAVRPDVALVGVDLKIVELSPWADRFSAIATTGEEASALIEAVRAEVTARYARMKTVGIRKVVEARPDVGPWLLLVVDELAELAEFAEVASIDDLVSITRLGRGCGVHVISATQYPSAKTLAKGLRDQHVWRWCGRMASTSTAAMVLGDGYQVDPTLIQIAERGVGVVVDHLGPHRLAQSDLLTDQQVTDVATATGELRIPLAWLEQQPTPA